MAHLFEAQARYIASGLADALRLSAQQQSQLEKDFLDAFRAVRDEAIDEAVSAAEMYGDPVIEDAIRELNTPRIANDL